MTKISTPLFPFKNLKLLKTNCSGNPSINHILLHAIYKPEDQNRLLRDRDFQFHSNPSTSLENIYTKLYTSYVLCRIEDHIANWIIYLFIGKNKHLSTWFQIVHYVTQQKMKKAQMWQKEAKIPLQEKCFTKKAELNWWQSCQFAISMIFGLIR